ncbi:MAG: hypothetical protein IIY73_04560, partial [Solobacterium sp.]|nr:hypothetical protein [Solobacterium sp.]
AGRGRHLYPDQGFLEVIHKPGGSTGFSFPPDRVRANQHIVSRLSGAYAVNRLPVLGIMNEDITGEGAAVRLTLFPNAEYS